MLIDRTYFVGEINIPNTSNQIVGEVLDHFIEKYEKEFLTNVLGYPLYTEFLTGLQQVSIEQKWTDLLTGSDYPYGSITKRFRGVVESPDNVIVIDTLGTTFITVGAVGLYNPVALASTTIIPAALVGKAFSFSQRGFGELIPLTDYTISGNTLTLLNWTFSEDDVYYYKSNTVVANSTPSISRHSMIANYVYYWYMRNQHSQSAGMGEVKGSNENSVQSNPGLKMARAWNEVYDWIYEMHEFLGASNTAYENWSVSNPYIYYSRRGKINVMNI